MAANSGSLDGHKLPDQLPIKGRDSQYAWPDDGKLYGPPITDTEGLAIAYPEGKVDHVSGGKA